MGVQTIPLNIMVQQIKKINNSNSRREIDNNGTANIVNITGDLVTPKQAWELLKIGKTRFYTLVEQGYITLIRFDYSGRKTFVSLSQLTELFPKDFIKN